MGRHREGGLMHDLEALARKIDQIDATTWTMLWAP